MSNSDAAIKPETDHDADHRGHTVPTSSAGLTCYAPVTVSITGKTWKEVVCRMADCLSGVEEEWKTRFRISRYGDDGGPVLVHSGELEYLCAEDAWLEIKLDGVEWALSLTVGEDGQPRVIIMPDKPDEDDVKLQIKDIGDNWKAISVTLTKNKGV